MKILVTGGAGFIGSNIANTMSREKNTAVVAFDDLSLGNPINLSQSVKFVKGSVMDFELTLEASKGCDYIFHSADLRAVTARVGPDGGSDHLPVVADFAFR